MNLFLKIPIIIDNLKDWIVLNKDEVSYTQAIETSEIHKAIIPNTLNGARLQFNLDQKPHDIYQRYIAEVKNVKLSNLHGQLLLGNKYIPVETVWIKENLDVSKRLFFKSVYRSESLEDVPYFSCLFFWSNEYYHWFCDILQRFHRVLDHLPTNTKFIVPKEMQIWKRESLKALGIKDEQLYFYDGKKPLSIKQFIYAPPVGMTGDNFSESAKWLSQKLRGERSPNNRKLFISRSKAKARNLINEEELMKKLTLFGFEKVNAEDMSYHEQRELFGSAKVIIAPHGAGLTNMLFCQDKCTIVEIFEPNSVRRCYWSLSNALGHSYHCFLGMPVKNHFEFNITIDVNEFMELLELKNII